MLIGCSSVWPSPCGEPSLTLAPAGGVEARLVPGSGVASGPGLMLQFSLRSAPGVTLPQERMGYFTNTCAPAIPAPRVALRTTFPGPPSGVGFFQHPAAFPPSVAVGPLVWSWASTTGGSFGADWATIAMSSSCTPTLVPITE